MPSRARCSTDAFATIFSMIGVEYQYLPVSYQCPADAHVESIVRLHVLGPATIPNGYPVCIRTFVPKVRNDSQRARFNGGTAVPNVMPGTTLC